MKIETQFEIGDQLYGLVEHAPIESDGISMLEVIHSPKYRVEGVQYSEEGIRIITSDDTICRPGGMHACLSHEDAMQWAKEKRPGALLLTGEKEVSALYVHGDGTKEHVRVQDSFKELGGYVYEPCCGHMDGNGYAALYDPSARKSGSPVSMFLLDQDGNPVDAMYGPFLLVKLEMQPDGLYCLADIADDVLPAKAPKDIEEDRKTAFSPFYRIMFHGMTLEQLCHALLETYPSDAHVNICGTGLFYGHYSPASNEFSLDESDLGDLPEYDGVGPREYGKDEKEEMPWN